MQTNSSGSFTANLIERNRVTAGSGWLHPTSAILIRLVMLVAEYLTSTITHLCALALILFCAFGMGSVFLRRCRFDNVAERLALTTTAGLGLCANLLFVLGLLRVLYAPVIWALTVAGAIATCLSFLYSHKRSESKDRRRGWRLRYFFTRRRGAMGLLLLLALGHWAILLMMAQFPPTIWDSVSEHLVVAREFLTQHRPVVLVGVPQPVLPALNHMLFTWALALQDDILAQMVEQAFSILTALGLYAWGKRQERAALGYAAAILWLAQPIGQVLAASAYVDIALTCFVFLGIYALRLFRDDRDVRWWYLGMSLLAMGAGVKLPGLFFLGIGSLLGLWIVIRPRIALARRKSAGENYDSEENRFTMKPLIIGGALAFGALIPWYGFVAYHTGNPFWPMLAQYSNGIWAAPWVVGNVKGVMSIGARTATLERFLTLSVDWLYDTGRFNLDERGRSLLPLMVIWPLAWIVSIFNRSVRWWIVWALAFTVYWFLQAPLLRYWLPVLPIACLALLESIQWILEKVWRPAQLKVVWASAGVLILLWSGWMVYGELTRRGLPPVTQAGRDNFLDIFAGYRAVKYVNANARNGDAVAVLSASWLNYYFDERVIDLRGALFQNRKPTFSWPDDQPWIEWLESENVDWIFVNYKTPEVSIPKQNPVLDPFWPDYKIVYADDLVWVFHREPN